MSVSPPGSRREVPASALDLRRRLGRTASRFALAEGLFGLTVAVAAACALWAFAAGAEALLWLPPAGRALLLALVLAPVAVLLARYAGRPALQRAGVLPGLSPDDAARRVGTRLPAVADRLTAFLHLTSGRRGEAPEPLVAGAAAGLARTLDGVRFDDAERFERPRRALRTAWVAPALLLAAFLAAPGSMRSASARLLAPGLRFERPAPFRLSVTPGSVTVAAGDSLTLRADVAGSERPSEVAVEVRRVGEERAETVRLMPDARGRYAHTVADVRQPFEYRVVALPVETEWFRVRVAQRPSVRSMQVTVAPPAYARQPRLALPPGVGDVAGLPGTAVAVAVATGGDGVDAAYLDFGPAGRVPLVLGAGGVGRASFTLRREGTYRVVVRSRSGLVNADAVDYRLTVLPDTPPSISLAAGGAAPALDLDVRVGDDYGFSRLALFSRVVRDSTATASPAGFRATALALPSTRPPAQAVRYGWRVPAARPGETVEFYAQVWDNNAAGAQSARTAVQRLTIPSPDEAARSLGREQDSTAAALDDLRRDAEAQREAFEELRNALRRPDAAGAQRQLDAMQARQQQLEEATERLSEQARDVAIQMREQEQASPKTAEQFRRLQQTLEELQDPALREALEELREAMQADDPERVREASERYEQRESDLRERLEQARALLERLRVKQELEMAAKQAEDLAREQAEMQEATEALERQQEAKPGETPQQKAQREQSAQEQAEQLAQQQEENAEQAEALEKLLREIQERMQNVPNAPREKMEQTRREAEQAETPEKMEQNAGQMRQGKQREAQQGQRQMQQQMQRMQQSLQQMEASMEKKDQQLNAAAIRRALDNVLRLSQRQEALRTRTQRADADSPSLRDASRQQAELQAGLRTVADTLGNVAKRIPLVSRAVQQDVGEAMREMQSSAARLSEREPPRAAGHQRSAMTHLNELALKLTDLLQQAQQAGNPSPSPGGGQSLQQMMEGLQKMAGEQQGMSDQVQRMINEQQGERLQPDAAGQAQGMAERQAQLRRELRQMSRNPESRGRMLGDLEEAAEEMERVAEELGRGRVSREMQERQRAILTRLLQAQKSLQERGQDERREGRRPGAVDADGPRAAPPPPTPEEQLRRDLLRALDAPYSTDYDLLIRRYFDRLRGGQ